jgi:hypothetical protein
MIINVNFNIIRRDDTLLFLFQNNFAAKVVIKKLLVYIENNQAT